MDKHTNWNIYYRKTLRSSSANIKKSFKTKAQLIDWLIVNLDKYPVVHTHLPHHATQYHITRHGNKIETEVSHYGETIYRIIMDKQERLYRQYLAYLVSREAY